MECVVSEMINCMFDCCGSSGHLNTLDHAFAYLRSAPNSGSRFWMWGGYGDRVRFGHVASPPRLCRIVVVAGSICRLSMLLVLRLCGRVWLKSLV